MSSPHHLDLQIGNLVAFANKQETDQEQKIDAALILTSAQASLLAQLQAPDILKELGLTSSHDVNAPHDVVINLIGDTAKSPLENTTRTEQQLVKFMQKVGKLYTKFDSLVRKGVFSIQFLFPFPSSWFDATPFVF